MKKVSEHLQQEWETLADQHNNQMTSGWISKNLLRPFLFFAARSSTLHQKLQFTNVKCMSTCFKILLRSINSTGMLSYHRFPMTAFSSPFFKPMLCFLHHPCTYLG